MHLIHSFNKKAITNLIVKALYKILFQNPILPGNHNFLYRFLIANIDDYQIFEDTSDTGRIDSGYSSHGRAMRSLKTDYPEVNTRSIFVATMANK